MSHFTTGDACIGDRRYSEGSIYSILIYEIPLAFTGESLRRQVMRLPVNRCVYTCVCVSANIKEQIVCTKVAGAKQYCGIDGGGETLIHLLITYIVLTACSIVIIHVTK